MDVSGRIDEKLKNQLINKSLEQHNTNVTKIYKEFPDGYPEKKVHWSDYYVWDNDEDYQIFKEWAIQHIMRETGIWRKSAEIEYVWFDMACGLRQPYLFGTKTKQKSLSF